MNEKKDEMKAINIFLSKHVIIKMFFVFDLEFEKDSFFIAAS